MTAAPLLPLRPAFLDRLAAVRELAVPLLRGPALGAAISGTAAEFEGYRPYLPGDDIRGVDWNLFARSGELYVKLFRVEEEIEAVLLLDESASMLAGGGAKFRAAAAACAALAYLGLLTSHPVTLLRYAERAREIFGPHRQLEAFTALSRRLAAPAAGGGTDLGRSLAPLLRGLRPMTVVAVTDGFQREPLARVAAAVRAAGRTRLVVVLVRDERDLRPPLRGNLLLQDDESAEAVAVLSDRELERELHGALARDAAARERELARGGAQVLSLPAQAPFEESFLSLLRARAL
jgi:uncharacterized protein (DUF58 family)